MTQKYRNRYRINSHRLPGWDYSKNGFYFITLVTQGRQSHLGDIVNGKMELSEWGNIVEKEWTESFKIREELLLDHWIIMPNHIHAIVIINNVNTATESHGAARQSQTLHRLPKSISTFIAGFKSAVNSQIDNNIDNSGKKIRKYNRKNHFFQPNYYDHIIRNSDEYVRISEYIINNPENWEGDSLNSAMKIGADLHRYSGIDRSQS